MRRRYKEERSMDEEKESTRGKRRSKPGRNEPIDFDDHVSRRTTRKRKERECIDGDESDGKKAKTERRNSGDLGFGRRSRNRNRGQNSEVSLLIPSLVFF